MAHTTEGYAHLVNIARKAETVLGADVKTCVVVSANEKPESLNWDGHILLDPRQELHTTYGAGAESLYFIQPDGYVGFRSQPVRDRPALIFPTLHAHRSHHRHNHPSTYYPSYKAEAAPLLLSHPLLKEPSW
jgi:hypothetical protein